MASTFKAHTVLLSVLGKLTINANESRSGDYLTSVTYRPRERVSETMGHERHETRHRALGRLAQLVAFWVSEGWEVRTPDVNKDDKWSFAKARSAPTPAHYGQLAITARAIPSAEAPPMPVAAAPMPTLIPLPSTPDRPPEPPIRTSDARHVPLHLSARPLQSSIFDWINEQIYAFVNQLENRRLRPGTGAFSTPFRGSLFGLLESARVATELTTRSVDVLWLGTNPCVPDSIAKILDPAAGEGRFPSFVRQMQSGMFSAWKWDADGRPSPDFNPIQTPVRNWLIYRDLLGTLFDLECVTMANLIPWGSSDAKQLLERLGGQSPELLQRMLAFADELNVEIVTALKPRLVVVPLSFGKNAAVDRAYSSDLSIRKAVDLRHHTIGTGSQTLNFYTATCRRGASAVRTAYLPHPASLHLTREAKPRVVAEITRVVAEFSG